MPGKIELPKRLPLVVTPENRDYTTSRDSRLVNCFLEKAHGDEYQIIKRPGISSTVITQYPSTNIGGIWSFLGTTYTIAGGSFYTNATVIGSVNTTGGRYWFSAIQGAIPKVVFSNTTHMYSYDTTNGLVAAGSVSPYPTTMVPGFAYLDGTLYTAIATGGIFGSKINDVTTWDTLNVIVAQIEPDQIVALAKQLTYVIVFKQWTTEVFYDAGNAAGSPLAPNQAAKMNYGCINGYSVLDIDGDLFWISSTRAGSIQVMMMHNLQAVVVSDGHIERLLQTSTIQAGTTLYAWNYKGEGHNFYVITLPDINITLAYDIRERSWSQWTDPSGNYVPVFQSTFSGHSAEVLTLTGALSQINAGIYMDVGVPFPMEIYTPNFDGGVDRRKTITRIRFNGDQTPGSILAVRCNDYDYDPLKWTNYRMVDMNRQRPFLDNCGTFYRRAYHLRQIGNCPFRMRSVDVDMDLGEL